MTLEYDEITNDAGNVYKRQHGGTHYQGMKITPVEYAMANNLNACEFSVVKYVSRHRLKNGKEDLLKAKDFIDMLIRHEYENQKQSHTSAFYFIRGQLYHLLGETRLERLKSGLNQKLWHRLHYTGTWNQCDTPKIRLL